MAMAVYLVYLNVFMTVPSWFCFYSFIVLRSGMGIKKMCKTINSLSLGDKSRIWSFRWNVLGSETGVLGESQIEKRPIRL